MKTAFRIPNRMLLGAVVWGCATAALATSASEQNSPLEPIVVAQMQAPAPSLRAAPAVDERAYPAYQAGVRRAAAEGNDALRRYVWRTRMIYNFYFNDFANKE